MERPNWLRWGGLVKRWSRHTVLSAALLLTTLAIAPACAETQLDHFSNAVPVAVDAKSADKGATKKPATPDKAKAEKLAAKKPTGKKPEASATKPPAKTKAIPAWEKSAPESVVDLLAIQNRVKGLLKKLIPTTVGIEVGGARGSGVIISADGYVLTAGHVSGTPNRPVTVILPDGKRVRAKSLGRNSGIDSGMFKIESNRKDWPHSKMGRSKTLNMGDWVIAIGHPGGWQRGRPPVVRLGRVISSNARVVWTDATLVGGDSGGPLFNLNGDVVGIHSRISGPTTANFHVPIDTFHDTWDRLAASEDFTDQPNFIGAVAGLNAENHKSGARLTSVTPRSPADKAGLKAGDIISRFGRKKLRNVNDLVAELNRKNPTDVVKVEYVRGEKVTKVDLTLAAGYRASPFLGITGKDVTESPGAVVNDVHKGTPAFKAKMQAEDVIVGFNGKVVRTLNQLQDNIRKLKAGAQIDLAVKRGDKDIKLKVTLGMRG